MPPLAANDSTIYFGSNSGYFYALDYFGNLKWKLAIPCFIYSSISKNGDLYITCETGDTVRIVSHSGEIKLIKYFNDIVGPISFSTDGSQIYFRTVTQTNSDKYSNLYCTDTQFNILWDYKFGEESYGYPAMIQLVQAKLHYTHLIN
jgi:outer membrane protein assembly factor BamB